MKACNLLALSAFVGAALASPIEQEAELAKRAGDTTTVNLNQCSGSPQLFGQGVLYGMSGTGAPLQQYITELKVNYESNGGAQSDASPAGYATSINSYNYRFQQVLNAYKRIRANNGVLIVKMADLWGADETTNNSFKFPGDNGDWTTYDNFINQMISDLKANGMANSYSTQLELWNEPDINFGGRPQSQFNAMFVRGTKALRAAFPKGGAFLPLVGPSSATPPANGQGFWQSFLGYLQSNGGQAYQPDVWNWHMEGGGE